MLFTAVGLELPSQEIAMAVNDTASATTAVQIVQSTVDRNISCCGGGSKVVSLVGSSQFFTPLLHSPI
jgi:hypothetical protein